MKKCIVIGSFDAFHNGHRDLLLYGLGIFDKLIIIVSDHPSKKYWFTAEERCEMLKLAMADYADRIEVSYHENAQMDLGDICRDNNAYHILRGIKAGRTVDDELRLQNIYRFVIKETCSFEPEFVYRLTSDSDFRGSWVVKNYAAFPEMLKLMVPEALVDIIHQRSKEING